MIKKIALIGAGAIGSRHAATVQKYPERATLVAVVEPDASRASAVKEKYQCETFSDVATLCRQADFDAAIVATPPSERQTSLSELLCRGVHVLMEKPVACDLSSAEKLRELVTAHDPRKVRVGFCHRFVDAVQKARVLLAAGELGDVVWMQVVFAGNNPDLQHRWSSDPQIAGGGAAMDNACHALDLFAFLDGRIEEVTGCYRYSWPGRGEDSFAISARSQGGALGSVLGSFISSTPRMFWEICGTKATLRYDYARGTELQLISASGTNGALGVSAAGGRFAGQFEAWLDDMNGNPVDMATFDDGFRIATYMESLKRLNPFLAARAA